MLKPFRLLRPTTVAEASEELRRLGEEAKVYAGGVELLLLMRQGLTDASYLVDVKDIAELGRMDWDGSRLRIGACFSHRALGEYSTEVAEHAPLLRESERHVGNIRVRAQGTIGGNLCFADPHADPGTALLVHEATVAVAGADSERELPLASFFRGMYDVDLQEGEILTAVNVPPLPSGWGWAFQRFEQFYRPTLNVAVAVRPHNGLVADVRLAVGCIGPKPLRLNELEGRLGGLPLADAQRVIGESARYLEDTLEPVADLLGSAEYKIHLTRVLLCRAISGAMLA